MRPIHEAIFMEYCYLCPPHLVSQEPGTLGLRLSGQRLIEEITDDYDEVNMLMPCAHRLTHGHLEHIAKITGKPSCCTSC